MRWFYMEGGQEQGPFEKDRMQEFVRLGTIGNDTYVRNDRNLNWTTYGWLVEMAASSPPDNHEQPAGEQERQEEAEPGTALCSECGDSYVTNRLVTYRGRQVCASCSPAMLQRIGEVFPVELYAGFWVRFLAKLIDGLIILVPLVALNVALAFMISDLDVWGKYTGELTPAVEAGLYLMHMLQLAIPLSYSTLFVGRYSATPGKMALGLMIILPGGGRVSYARALGRHLAELLSRIILYAGYIMASFDDEKRALHDHIAGTRVIKKHIGSGI